FTFKFWVFALHIWWQYPLFAVPTGIVQNLPSPKSGQSFHRRETRALIREDRNMPDCHLKPTGPTTEAPLKSKKNTTCETACFLAAKTRAPQKHHLAEAP